VPDSEQVTPITAPFTLSSSKGPRLGAPCRDLRVGAVLLAIFLATAAQASPIALLAQPQVPQFAQVVNGFHGAHADVPVVDVGDASAVDAAFGANPEIVIAVGSKAFELAKQRAHDALIVGAAVMAADPQGRADVTAVPLEPRAADALAAIAQLSPGAKVVAFYPATWSQELLGDAQAAAKSSGLAVSFHPVAELSGFQDLFVQKLAGAGAAWLLTDARLAKPEVVNFMVEAALEKKVLLFGFLDGMARAGAAAAISADYVKIGEQAGALATELLAKPKAARAHVAFRFAPGKLVVNEKSREALGLTGSVPGGAQVVR
jgi:ABC-type uncharacterized transport system substrate-binding protein